MAAPRTSAFRGRLWSSSTRRSRAASITSTRSTAIRPTTMVRSSHAGRVAAFAIAAAAAVAFGTDASAHRRDEYLQAARVAIDPDRVQIELDLTAGIAVADSVLADIDLDRDGLLSPAETREYSERVVSAIALDVDGTPLRLEVARSDFPTMDAVRAGEGIVRIDVVAA